ncbi:CDPK-related kinase 5-like [Rhododendron vialii]|uniref:CDPK-related kinase 5-like n=1 Tax=Rhododendron vialii TaxID=182163 RepID=UPI00265E4367|nr:CDPK-related kinase 5-like [Rhododendron vialii]
MGICTSKPPTETSNRYANPAKDIINSGPGNDAVKPSDTAQNPTNEDIGKKSPFFPFYSPSPAHYLFSKKTPAANGGSATSTPKRFFRRPFPPPSPARHIRAALARRQGSVKPNGSEGGAIPEGSEAAGEEGGGRVVGLDKSFGFSKNFGGKYEIGEEVGRGHFGYTCRAKFKKGEMKGQEVAVKVIPKVKMTTAIAIEDVRREVKILRALSGHNNLVQFYDAFEDNENVYVVMELCEGGELLDRILARGGKYTEDEAKAVLVQILNVVSFCHLQGVVHRDLKPENFLFTSKEENSPLKAIDFGLSDFVKPDARLNDIVGSAYYVAPEVLHRSYSTEADVWSIGVISYILLCGSRPFWARTESGIFRAVLKVDPSFDESPWPSLSSEAKDFVKRLLNKDPRKRMSAAQALSHPWIKNNNDAKVPLDIMIFKLMKAYMRSSALRKAALRALSKTLTVDELFYLKEQYALLVPNKNGTISFDNIKAALTKNATDAMKESHVLEFLASLNALQYRRMDFEEFCAASLSVHQLEALERWEQHARCAYELFESDGNRAIVIEELASELGVSPSIPVHAVLHDWIRHTDGKLSFLGFVKLLHGVSSRSLAKSQ